MDDTAEARLAAGDPHGALAALQARVRERPADPAARVFLFQLLCVLGQWSRAGNQLEVAAEMDPAALLMAQTYRELLRCEVMREAVFDGRRAPMVMGEPPAWMAPLVQALPFAAAGDGERAAALAAEAFELAPGSTGSLEVRRAHTSDAAGRADADNSGHAVAGAGESGASDGASSARLAARPDAIPFDWIGDADMRLGPVLEAMIDGKYYWVPFERLDSLVIDAPDDLRDLVWTSASFTWQGGGESVGFVPTRYPRRSRTAAGGESARDDENGRDADREAGSLADEPACLMSRRTEWQALENDYFIGHGQRLFASSAGDHALLECGALRFDAVAAD